jgi:hypothetical protein
LSYAWSWEIPDAFLAWKRGFANWLYQNTSPWSRRRRR